MKIGGFSSTTVLTRFKERRNSMIVRGENKIITKVIKKTFGIFFIEMSNLFSLKILNHTESFAPAAIICYSSKDNLS